MVELTVVLAWLAFSAFLLLLSLVSQDELGLAFMLAFGASLITLGAFLNNTGYEYLSNKNSTMNYSYLPFNATSNESRIANVSIVQNYGYTPVKNEYSMVVGWAFIILGAFSPIAGVFAYYRALERKARKKEEQD